MAREIGQAGRRSVLRALGAAAVGGGLASSGVMAQNSTPVVRQDGTCEQLTPLRGDRPVSEFYSYRRKTGPVAAEEGWKDQPQSGLVGLMQDDTSILLLYDGPEALSLVVVHGHQGGQGNGGSATMRFAGLPGGGEWVVEDDRYEGPTSHDRWDHNGGTSVVHWTWKDSFADGAVFKGLPSEFHVGIDPSFNESARLYGDVGMGYDGSVKNWKALSGSAEDPEEIELAMGRPVLVTTRGCPGG